MALRFKTMKIEHFIVGVVVVVFGVGVIYRLRLRKAGLQVTSWIRNPFHNADVGGVANSKHLIGWAFDIVPVNDIVKQRLRNAGFKKILNETSHFHVEIV